MNTYDPQWPAEGVAGAPTLDTTPRGHTLRRGAAIGWIIAGAVLVRIVLFLALGDLPLRGDEVEYHQIAVNLVEGRGFALNDRLTSWRPPLYPFVLAAVYTATGSTDPRAMHLFQIALSAVTVLVVYLLGRRLFGESTGLLAAAMLAFYPSLIFYNVHLLTEVVFTFWVTLTLFAFAGYVSATTAPVRGRHGTLSRSGRPQPRRHPPSRPPLALLMVKPARRAWGRTAGYALACLLATGAVVGPWIARNTALNGTFTSISTNGGPAILAGNNAHTPLDRPWKYHDFDREQRWRSLVPDNVTEGQRQRVAVSVAIEYMREHPGLTLQRSIVKAANVWGLEREIVGTILTGHYGEVRPLIVILRHRGDIRGVRGHPPGRDRPASPGPCGPERTDRFTSSSSAWWPSSRRRARRGLRPPALPPPPDAALLRLCRARVMHRGAIWRERRSPALLVAGAWPG